MSEFIILISVKQIIAAAIFGVFGVLFAIVCYVIISKFADMFDRYSGNAENWHITPKDHHDTQ
jgi:predicted PurR-regulated permease PerM